MDAVFGVNDLCDPHERTERVQLGTPTIPPVLDDSTRHDLAFFRLRNDAVPGAPWPPPPEAADGRLAVAGWGATQLNGPRRCEPIASTADLLSDLACAERLSGMGRAFDRSTERCAVLHPDQCQGSSGAPLVADGEHALGVLSWAPGCALGFPAVFVDLHKSFAILCEAGSLTVESGVC